MPRTEFRARVLAGFDAMEVAYPDDAVAVVCHPLADLGSDQQHDRVVGAVGVEALDLQLENAKALYLEGIRDGRARKAVETYTGDRYTQHSTGVADGVEGFVAFFEPFIERNPQRDIRWSGASPLWPR